MGMPGAGSHLVQCPPPGDRPPVLRAEPAAKGQFRQGHRARKASWSETASARWPNHQSPSQGHTARMTLTTLTPQGHKMTLTPQGHKMTSTPQGHRTTLTPQGHRMIWTPQGHRTTLTARPYRLQGRTALKTSLTLRPHNFDPCWKSRLVSVKTWTRYQTRLHLIVIRSNGRKTSWTGV